MDCQRHALAALPRGWPGTHCIGCWTGPRADLDGCGISPPPGFDLRTVQPVERFTSYIMCILFWIVYIIQIYTYYFNANFQSNCNKTLLFIKFSSYAIFPHTSAPTVYSKISTYVMFHYNYYYYYYYYFNVIRISYFINVFYLRMILKELKHVESLIFSVQNYRPQ